MLADGTAGSGVDHYLYRYQAQDQQWSEWRTAPSNEVEIQAGPPGQTIMFEVAAQDAVGNPSDASLTPIVIADEGYQDDPDDDADGADDDLDDGDISGPLLASGGTALNLLALFPHAAASSASAAAGGSSPSIEDCPKSGSSGNEYMWFRLKRKAITPEEGANDWRKYSLHIQARTAFIPMADHSQMQVWRKVFATDRKRKLHTNQTNPTRPKTKYYAHSQLHIRIHTYFHWRGLITWRGKGIYERTIVLPDGQEIDEYTQATQDVGGCRA